MTRGCSKCPHINSLLRTLVVLATKHNFTFISRIMPLLLSVLPAPHNRTSCSGAAALASQPQLLQTPSSNYINCRNLSGGGATLQRFSKFCIQFQVAHGLCFTPSQETLEQFVTFYASSLHLVYVTIKSYLCGIRHHFVFAWLFRCNFV